MRSSLKNNAKFYRNIYRIFVNIFDLTKRKEEKMKVEDCRGFVPSHLFGSYLSKNTFTNNNIIHRNIILKIALWRSEYGSRFTLFCIIKKELFEFILYSVPFYSENFKLKKKKEKKRSIVNLIVTKIEDPSASRKSSFWEILYYLGYKGGKMGIGQFLFKSPQ